MGSFVLTKNYFIEERSKSMQTILGLFDNHESVKAVYDDLLQEGLNARDI